MRISQKEPTNTNTKETARSQTNKEELSSTKIAKEDLQNCTPCQETPIHRQTMASTGKMIEMCITLNINRDGGMSAQYNHKYCNTTVLDFCRLRRRPSCKMKEL